LKLRVSVKERSRLAKTMPKRPRLPANLDDDEAVERYLSRLKNEEVKAAEELEAARTAGLATPALEAEVARKVSQVISNIMAGDSVCPFESVYLFINRGDELGKPDAVRVLVVEDHDDPDARKDNPDAQILMRLCADNDWSREDFARL
jgi:hypothetical protein